MPGIEPGTSSLPRMRSTPELQRLKGYPVSTQLRAGDETRTRDPQLGRLMLYQLSYSRLYSIIKTFTTNLLFSCLFWGTVYIQKNVGMIGFEPIQPKQQIYSLPRLSNFGASPSFYPPCEPWLKKSQWRDSNPRPTDYKSVALANWATLAVFWSI